MNAGVSTFAARRLAARPAKESPPPNIVLKDRGKPPPPLRCLWQAAILLRKQEASLAPTHRGTVMF